MMIGLIGACFLLGIAIGCCSIARMGDIYGRKKMFLFPMILMLFCYFLLLFTKNAPLCYILMVIIGFACSGK